MPIRYRSQHLPESRPSGNVPVTGLRVGPVNRLLVLIACLALGAAATAQVYRVVDEDGRVTYTDRPPTEGAEPVEVRVPNTSPPPPSGVFPEPRQEPASEPEVSYLVSVTSPPDETIIPRGPGNFSVSASVSPRLQQGHQLQLLLDGEPRQEPKTSGLWDLTNVFRGEHQLTVAVVNKDGKQLGISEPVTVYVFRPSSNFNRPRPTPK